MFKNAVLFPQRRVQTWLWNSNTTTVVCRKRRANVSYAIERCCSSSPPQPQSQSTLQQSPSKIGRKRLDVAIVGAPNAGKSQLVNILTQSPVAAVSRKRHTTRSDILGARTIGNTQIVFKDTPGFMRIENAKEERLDRDLIATAASEMQDVDFTLLVIDSARALSENYRHAFVQLMIGAINSKGRIEESFGGDDEIGDDKSFINNHRNSDDDADANSNSNDGKGKFAIVLNKVDLVKPKSTLIDLAMDIGAIADTCLEDQFTKHGKKLDFEAMLEYAPIVFYVSALKEDGTDDILDHLVNLATPCKEWAVQSGQSTNMTELEQIQEIIREKIYRTCHREVPHSVQQINRMFRKIPKKGVVIHQDLVVFTKSHQKLVLGAGGRTLERIRESAQTDLQKMFKCDVSLHLHVKKKIGRRGDSGTEYKIGEVSQSIL
ncbi:MAG: GTP-binding protein Era [Bacillariaceae sp.]|jgi:GTP-binding protein Era